MKPANWKRATASALTLAVLMIVTAVHTPAAEPKGTLSSQEVRTLTATAKTPADHMKLARHYTAKAEKHEAEAKEHDALAA